MKIFDLHNEIINDYENYIKSFINIHDDDICEKVEKELSSKKLWPEPLIQFNPAFKSYGKIKQLTTDGTFEPKLSDIFSDFNLYEHQVQAIKMGTQGKDFIVTSGTGSGKSLTYIGTIFNYLTKNKNLRPGIKAVIVYPMNALINSQTEEFNKYRKKYEEESGKTFPVTYGQYTGQEGEATRRKLQQQPPDIILTNYMMLELILSRIKDRDIRNSIYSNLRFLVFDELHTYRGRQGSDVALLIRRIKSCCQEKISCIGTSATMISGGTIREQKQEVAHVASTLFGVKFTEEQIINETLASSFGKDTELPSKEKLKKSINTSVKNMTEQELKQHVTAIWLEKEIALTEKEGVLVRNAPKTLTEIATELQKDTGENFKKCHNHLQELLKQVSDVNAELAKQNKRYKYLPFKIHQLISQTGSVYVTLGEKGKRGISLEPGVYQYEQGKQKPLFPVVFSRYSGYSFICVSRNQYENKINARDFNSYPEEDEDADAGYLILDYVWNADEDLESLPPSWIKKNRKGEIKIVKKYEKRCPIRIYFDDQGNYSENTKENLPYQGWFMPAKLLFDPTSGVFFDAKTKESTKLAQIGSEKRSSSTTILTLSILKHLEGYKFPREDQKLLSFTDNRQDAALQAGHFNDYLNVIHIRSAIYNALVKAKNNELTYKNLGTALFNAIQLDFDEFANVTSKKVISKRKTSYEDAMKNYLVYRALHDLRRGWRVVLPNLEQSGLLKIEYQDLKNICKEDNFEDIPALKKMSLTKRVEFIKQVLEYFRLSYAIHSEEFLSRERLQENKKEIEEKLKDPWKFNSDRDIQEPYFLYYEANSSISSQRYYTSSIGLTSRLGKYIRDALTKYKKFANRKEYNEFIKKLMNLLCDFDFLHKKVVKGTELFQLKITYVMWKIGDKKTVPTDLVFNRSYKQVKIVPNVFFQQLYMTNFASMKNLRGEDHTGQLSNDDRKDREKFFREGKLSALFCSPTMELGIDIKNLSVVHMRNVPPNPANYAQRSGRAGRGGQAALVFTYCSSYASHDRHYFMHPRNLVAGVVAPPKIDLINEDLLRSHLNALFVSEVGIKDLNNSIEMIIDSDDFPKLPLRNDVVASLRIPQNVLQNIEKTFKRVVYDFRIELQNKVTWYSDSWTATQLRDVIDNLDKAMIRWRHLYIMAKHLLRSSTEALGSGKYSVGTREYKLQQSNQFHAQRKIDILRNGKTGRANSLSEFYPYRYLASEGFLPGYNFTRLPLRTYIPKGDGEYISRPRNIALREFGPGSLIYHSGKKYLVRQLDVSDAENSLQRAKICLNSGYIMTGEQLDLERCPFSDVALYDSANSEMLTDLIEMSDTQSEERERISCEEEERISRGFKIKTYFSIDSQHQYMANASLQENDEALLKLKFMASTRLYHISKKWLKSNIKGFPLGMTSGMWKLKKSIERDKEAENIRNVQLFTTDTADAIYISPCKKLNLDYTAVITMQYALKRAIENIFQIEPSEIAVECMGKKDSTNIFIYESTEGSLGILSQLVSNTEKLREVIEKAIEVCRFDDEDYLEPASYNDLLSYYNQRYHRIMDRFKIQEALLRLRNAKIDLTNDCFDNYEDQYAKLKKDIDSNSSTEEKFIDYLYGNNLCLPDTAQQHIPEIYVRPDFFYKDNSICIFCDGTPHDHDYIREDDSDKRAQLETYGYEVLVYHYRDSIENFIQSRPDIFKKVREQ